ncbi:MAG: DMT family transporter, partial [Planctomycetota bacterium]
MSASGKGLLAIAVGTVLWGINFPVAKYALEALDPFFVAGFRFAVAGLVFFFLIPRRRRPELFRRGMVGTIALLSLTGVVLGQLFFINGMERTTPGHSAVLMAMIPIFVAVFARLFLGERLKVLAWTGILLGGAGAAGVILSKPPGEGEATLVGDLMILGTTVSF